MLSLRGHIDYGNPGAGVLGQEEKRRVQSEKREDSLVSHFSYLAPNSAKAPVASVRDSSISADASDHARDWCPHCGGPLGRRPQLFQHPCFDDTAWAIRKTEDGRRKTEEEGGPSSVIRPQPGAWRLLCALRAAFGHFVSRDYLLAQVQPRKGEEADPKIVEVYLCYLRKALAHTPFLIEARRGTGCWRLIFRDQEAGIRDGDQETPASPPPPF
jgi:hypothetical protein